MRADPWPAWRVSKTLSLLAVLALAALAPLLVPGAGAIPPDPDPSKPTVGNPSSTPVTFGATAGATKYLKVYVHGGATSLAVSMSGPACTVPEACFDVDLTVSSCTPLLYGNSESCFFGNPMQGWWVISMHHYSNDPAAPGGTVTINVNHNGVNAAPVVEFTASPTTLLPGTLVNFNAGATTDSDGIRVSYDWDFDGDGAYDQTTPGPTLSHVYEAPGVFDVTVRVTDDEGKAGTLTKNDFIRVQAELAVDILEAGPVAGQVGEAIALTAAVAGGSPPIACQWSVPVEATIAGATSCTSASLTFSAPGFVTARLDATDASGQAAYDTVVLNVNSAPCSQDCPVEPCETCPIADFRYRIDAVDGFRVTFEDRSVDPDGDLASWAWNFGDGTTSSLQLPTHTFPGYGSYVVTLYATDAAGDVGKAQRVLSFQTEPTYSGSAPTADPGSPSRSASEGDRVALGPSRPQPGLTYRWTQVEGPPVLLSDPTSPNPWFEAPATAFGSTLSFELVVYDGRMSSAPTRVTVEVLPANQAPAADAGPDFEVREGAAATLDGSRSRDPDGDAVVATWRQVAGPTVALQQEALGARFTAPFVGVNPGVDLEFVLELADGRAVGMDRVRVHILNDNEAPVAAFTAQPVEATPGLVSFRDASQDAEGIALVLWDFGDGSFQEAATDPTHRYARSGDYTVTLTVVDDGGATRTFTSVVQVQVPQPAGADGAPSADGGGNDAPGPAAALLGALLLALASARRGRRGHPPAGP